MNVEYINPFIQAANSVLKTITGVGLQVGRPGLRPKTFTLQGLVIMLRVTGDIDGQIFFEMTNDSAKKIASSMMSGMHVIKFDELSTSAICEMGNMIIGNAGAIFYGKSIEINMTPPTVLVGDKIQIQNKIPTFVIPIKLDRVGELRMYVNAEEMKKITQVDELQESEHGTENS